MSDIPRPPAPSDDEGSKQTRRQFFSRTAGAAGLLGALQQSRAAFAAAPGKPSPFPGGRKPNFLIILVDEERFPPDYENAAIKQWRKDNLKAQEFLRDRGLEFTRHYTGATACTPARNTIFTGHYPSLHGQTQTDGVAKSAFDKNMFWLDANTVPTMGNYFRAAGYKTYYKGKWHVSEANILIPGSKKPLLSFDPETGERDAAGEQIYLKADRLDDFGFSGWIGPEPHGANPFLSGSSAPQPTPESVSGRDQAYAQYVVEQLEELERKPAASEPWVLVASFVNPHDITLFGFFSQLSPNFEFEVDGTVPAIPPSPTDGQGFGDRPTCHLSYKLAYERAFQPTANTEHYRRFYYQLQKNVDQEIQKVLDKLVATRFYQDTIVLFTSDHGELLGSHGGIFQKWHNAYDETLRVPFIVHNPRLYAGRQTQDMLTSHVDILPTMLALAGADPNALAPSLTPTHSDVRPLVGRDLSALVLASGTPQRANEPIYFMTDDEPTRGSYQENFTGFTYTSVRQPNHLETVIAKVNGQLWKYTRYFDNPNFWNKPCQSDQVPRLELYGEADLCDTVTKLFPIPDQHELYNLSTDPHETTNLASTNPSMRATMAALLVQQRNQKRLTPENAQEQGVTACPVAGSASLSLTPRSGAAA